jgi:hypothetical protein
MQKEKLTPFAEAKTPLHQHFLDQTIMRSAVPARRAWPASGPASPHPKRARMSEERNNTCESFDTLQFSRALYWVAYC